MGGKIIIWICLKNIVNMCSMQVNFSIQNKKYIYIKFKEIFSFSKKKQTKPLI